jgi:hypothetical protein
MAPTCEQAGKAKSDIPQPFPRYCLILAELYFTIRKTCLCHHFDAIVFVAAQS